MSKLHINFFLSGFFDQQGVEEPGGPEGAEQPSGDGGQRVRQAADVQRPGG